MMIFISITNINIVITINIVVIRYEQQGIGLHWGNINVSPMEGLNMDGF